MLLSVMATASATKWINLDIIVQKIKIKLKSMQMEMPEQIKHRFTKTESYPHIKYFANLPPILEAKVEKTKLSKR